MRTHPHSNQKFLHYESINQNPSFHKGVFPVKVRPLNWILSRGERARNRGYARRNYSALPSTPSSAFTGNNHGSADSRLVIIIAPSVASLLRSSCVLRPRGWVLGRRGWNECHASIIEGGWTTRRRLSRARRE